jgi:hypothetical protein
MKVPLTEKDLHIQLADVRNRYPHLKDDEVFLLWFLSATVTDNESEAATALTVPIIRYRFMSHELSPLGWILASG